MELYGGSRPDEGAFAAAGVGADGDGATPPPTMSDTVPVFSPTTTRPQIKSSMQRSQPRPIQTSSGPVGANLPHSLLPSAPTSPPTPAPSPTPHQKAPDWSTAAEHEDTQVRDVRALFSRMNDAEKQRLLAELLNMCNSHQLSFVHNFVSPRLKKDPFTNLPNELCLRVGVLPAFHMFVSAVGSQLQILTFIDDPTTLARSSQVSKRWRELVSDDMAWKSLCEKHAYRRLSGGSPSAPHFLASPLGTPRQSPFPPHVTTGSLVAAVGPAGGATDRRAQSLDRGGDARPYKRRTKTMSYRSHFKQRYMVETAWRCGGKAEPRQITPDQGVVTSLHLTSKYIVVALDNAKIHVFDTDGAHQKTLQGHVMGVWAMVPWDDVLVSGGCDRDVRVWNMATG